MTVKEKVFKLIAKKLAIPEDHLKPDTRFADLQASLHDICSLMSGLKRRFKFELSGGKDVLVYMTIGQIADRVEAKVLKT